MSLLHRGTDTVKVYPEETTTDSDGNTIARASAIGVLCRAVVQPLGTPTEDQDGGYLTETRYRLRLVGWPGDVLGAQSQVEWRGNRYSLHGEPRIYSGSRRTAHVDYLLIRA
jgi:hypothetical protein